MSPAARKWLKFSLRWGIAVAGIAIVVSKITWRNRALVLGDNQRPLQVRVLSRAGSGPDELLTVDDPATGRQWEVKRDKLVNPADRKTISVGGTEVQFLACRLREGKGRAWESKTWEATDLLVADSASAPARWIKPADADGGYALRVPYPDIQVGLLPLWAQGTGRPWLLWAALLVFPITIVICSFRWHELLKALDIHIGQARVFVLNMVGNFYNTFMLGSTGGDVLKAYYASKQTVHRTRAVMSVFIDRAIGLLSLVLLCGVMGAYQYFTITVAGDPGRRVCGKVALGAAAVFAGTAAGLFVFYHPVLRRYSGLDFIIARLPMQKQVKNAVESMNMLRRHGLLVLLMLVATLPVHSAVVVSALFAGQAFGLAMSPGYYFVAVPMIVLAGSIPISPQGAGVMEAMAILLVSRQGATASEAVALVLSIRIVQILWCLTGGFFVFRGGYHAPPASAQQQLMEPENASA
jgi:glycosyltransferase 2 family protein